jgi:hypothetical protein
MTATAQRLTAITAIPLLRERRSLPGFGAWQRQLAEEATGLRGQLRAILEAKLDRQEDWRPFYELGRLFDTYRSRRYAMQSGEPARESNQCQAPPGRWLIVGSRIEPHLTEDTVAVFRWLSERLPNPFAGMLLTIEHVAGGRPTDEEELRRRVRDLTPRQRNVLREFQDRRTTVIKKLNWRELGFESERTASNTASDLRKAGFCDKDSNGWFVLPDVLPILLSFDQHDASCGAPGQDAATMSEMSVPARENSNS